MPAEPLYIIGVVLVVALIIREILVRRYVRRTTKRIIAIRAQTDELHRKRRQLRVDDYKLSLHEPYRGKKKT